MQLFNKLNFPYKATRINDVIIVNKYQLNDIEGDHDLSDDYLKLILKIDSGDYKTNLEILYNLKFTI